MNLPNIINRLIERSPKENFYSLKQRLQGHEAKYDLNMVASSTKHMNATILIDRLLRYQRVIQQQTSWKMLDFNQKSVLEIGSGPLLGWGPLAVYLGCEEYHCFDSAYDPKILKSEYIWENYFRPFYAQLIANFPNRLTFDEFKDCILNSIFCHNSKFGMSPVEISQLDIVLSNSVLEHVQNLESFFETLKSLSSLQCLHLHAVDFSNHKHTENPFEGIYETDPEHVHSQKSPISHLNLKKPSELMKMFQRYGFYVQFIPYLSFEQFSGENIHPYWKKFPKEELYLGVGFIVSQFN